MTDAKEQAKNDASPAPAPAPAAPPSAPRGGPAMLALAGVVAGALALGGALGTIAVITRQEIVLFIMGGVFVAETVSVMLQVAYFRLSGGRRIFRMAPLHHHFELSGWKENQVVVRFWIITIMLVLVGLSTLKIR